MAEGATLMEDSPGPIDPARAPNIEDPAPLLEAPARPARPCPCHIVFEGLAPSEALKTEVRAWLERLGALTAPVTRAEVAFEAVDQGRNERRYRVRMELAMPAGAVIVGPDHVANVPHEDVYVAIRNAFRAARRELALQLQDPPPGASR